MGVSISFLQFIQQYKIIRFKNRILITEKCRYCKNSMQMKLSGLHDWHMFLTAVSGVDGFP